MSLANATPLVLVGAGKMGGAMLAGWLDRGLDPGGVTVIDPGPPPEITALLADKGITSQTNTDGISTPATLVLAVKPQMMADVLPTLRQIAGTGTVAISIAAGTTLGNLRAGLGPDPALVRAMPNTPAQIGRGITAIYAAPEVTPTQREVVTSLLEAVGAVVWLDKETEIDAVTAVSGSGPAYVFLLAECLAAAAIKAGLSQETAARLARETVSGAGELLRQSDLDPATLRKNVTSPGGTTAAALEVLMGRPGLAELMADAVAAAARRSKELAG